MLGVSLNVSMDRVWLQVFFFFFLVKQTYTQEREKMVKGVAATNNFNSH